MKKIFIFMLLIMVAATSLALTYPINHRYVSNPNLLRKMLQNRIGALDTAVAALENDSWAGSRGTGLIFYVNSSASNGAATTWETAKTTLDAVFVLCEDDRGDVIYVAQGHAETLAADITADINGVTIVMLGNGNNAPTFTYDTTTDKFIVDAYGVWIYGGRYVAGIAEVAAAFTLTDESDYFMIIGGEFPEPSNAGYEFDKVFQLTTGADNGLIANCTVINQAGTPGMTSIIDGGAGAIDSLAVIGNHWNVDADVALIFSDQADTNLIISGNTFIQEDVDQFCIELTSTAMGIISNNSYGNLGGTAFLLDAGSCFQENNFASVAVDASAFLWPAPTIYTIAGQEYAVTMNMGAAHSDDLFEVTGGPILITSLTFYCTTDVASTNTWTIILDHVDKDIEFTTAVDVAAANDGDRIIFTSANPAVLTILALTDNVGSSNLMSSWYCPIGMIEVVNDNSTQVGVFDVYMTYVPLIDGVVVTAQ